MRTMDVVIEGNCYLSGSLERCCIGIADGRIAKIAKVLEGDKAYRFEDDKLILPAGTDAHVHFREPGMTHKEDFASGSLAALHGGITCCFDMPNTRPQTTTLEALLEKRQFAASKSLADFGIFAGVVKGADVPSLAKESIGFKLYMGGTTGDMLVPLETVAPELAAVASSRKVLAVHAEDERLRKKEPETDLNDHLRNRGNEVETSAIRKIMEKSGGNRLHICHVSAKESLALIGKGATSEVTPHHLLLDKDSKLGAMGKVNPPLRRREDRQALFTALKKGAFDIVASDHAPHTIEEKEEDFEYAPSGMPGVETMMPLMLDLVRKRHLALEDVMRRICENPPEIFGVRKGKIAVGYHGDLIAVEMDTPKTIKADKLHSRCGWTAFEGMTGVFPTHVFLRGRLMLDGDDQVGERNGRDVVERRKTS